MPFIENIKTKVKHAPYKFSAQALVVGTLAFTKDIDGVRDNVPEPFDIMDHAGNIATSAHLGYASGLSLGLLAAKRMNERFENSSIKSLRAKMALGGFVTGLVINSLVETKFGISISNWQNTADPLDLAYGVTAATLSAGLVPNIEQHPKLEYVPNNQTTNESVSIK